VLSYILKQVIMTVLDKYARYLIKNLKIMSDNLIITWGFFFTIQALHDEK